MPISPVINTLRNLIPTLLPVSGKLNQCLANTLHQQYKDIPELSSLLEDANSVVFSFRDQNYSAKNGGFHPVEICLIKQKDNTWQYAYITDFAYVGSHYPELAKELDFDFLRGEWLAHCLGGYSPIKDDMAARELYKLWESNFLAYCDMGMYDQIEISLS